MIATNCNTWKQILQDVEEQQLIIKRRQTETLDCMGFNAWELAVLLENYLALWLSDTMYRKRKNLWGDEKGNGSNCGASYARTTRAREARRSSRPEPWRCTCSRSARRLSTLAITLTRGRTRRRSSVRICQTLQVSYWSCSRRRCRLPSTIN